LGWRETRVQDERLRFIEEALLAEEALSELCRRWGVSRKTGYKWLERYQAEGVAGLADRSRSPQRRPRATGPATEAAIVALRAARPRWGERKLAAWLARERPEERWPAASTIGAILKRRGLTFARKRRRRATPSATLAAAGGPNAVWAIDFKGWFRTADGRRVEPLTLSDAASRYLLRCQAVERGDFVHVRPLVEAAFREYGLPAAIRSDNGPPFASTGLGGLSRLSVWWIRLGIRPERIAPGHPEQNGRHERLHRTLKQETAQPPAATARAQQRAFDRFRRDYNHERPHEALAMAVPASRYEPSPRSYPARLPELEYPAGFALRRVEAHGDVNFRNRRFFLSEVLAGETVGLEETARGWRLWFGPLELGELDERSLRPRSGARATASGRPPGSRQPRRAPLEPDPAPNRQPQTVTHVSG